MKSPLAYFGNRGDQKKDIFNLVQDYSQSQRGKQYDCCYDFFSGSGSMSFWAIENDLAKRYVINDVFAPLAAFWQEVKESPEELIKEYSLLLEQYEKADNKIVYFSALQGNFNQNAFKTKSQYAAAFAFLINHAEHGVPLLTSRNGKQLLECQLTQEPGRLKIDGEFAESVKSIHDLFKDKNIEFKSDSFCEIKMDAISSDDFIILDPPYPDMDDAEEKPEQHIYPRSEPKATLQQNLNKCLSVLDDKGTTFFMFYGVLGMKNNHPIVWPKGHVLHLSGEPTHPFGEYIEHLYLSSSLAKYFVDHLSRFQGNIQPLFYRIFETHALEEPEQFKNGKRHALAWEEKGELRHLTYAALNKSANRLAHYLLKSGLEARLEKGEEPLVGIYLDRSPAFIIAILAVMKTGASYLPLETNQERLDLRASAERLQQSNACFLLTHTDLDEKLREQPSFKNYPNMHVVSMDRADSTCEQLIARLKLNDSEFESNPGRDVKPESIANVMYTSGSTGTPKGVEVLQRGLPLAFGSHQDVLNLGPKDRVALFASPGFDASLMEIMMAIGAGATLYLVNDEAYQDRRLLIEFLRVHKITVIIQTPNMLANLPHDQFPSLRGLFIVGDKFKKALSDLWIVDLGDKYRQVFNGFGTTEGTICNSLAECAQKEPLTSGEPILGSEVLLRKLGPDYSSEQDEEKMDVKSLETSHWLTARDSNQEGELYITGPCLARGYRGRDDLTAERFFNNVEIGGKKVPRMYRTGDTARFTASGMLEITGRIGRQIKISGQRIELGEVENCLKELKGVIKDVRTVTHQSSDSANKILVSFIETYPNRALSNGETLEAILQHLKVKPYYMHPALIIFLDSLPRKGDKLSYDDQALLKKLKPEVELEQKVQPTASPKPIDTWLREIYAKFLGVTESVLEDFDFVSLGGDSIKVSRCLEFIKKHAYEQPEWKCELQQLTIADLSNSSVTNLIERLKDCKRAFKTELEQRSHEEKSAFHEGNYVDRLMLSRHGVSKKNEMIYGKMSLPLFCIPSLLGNADLDYTSSVLQQLKTDLVLLNIPEKIYALIDEKISEEKKPAIFIASLVAYFVQEIRSHNPAGPYWLLGWSSGGHIALKVAEKLRQTNSRVFVYLLDTCHPKLQQDISVEQHAHELIAIGNKIEEGVKHYAEELIDFPKLPTKEFLMQWQNKITQCREFFISLLSNMRKLRSSIDKEKQILNKEKLDVVEKLILAAQIIYLSELCIPSNQYPVLNRDDVLFIAGSNASDRQQANLGWITKDEPRIIIMNQTNHFSMLRSAHLVEEINKLIYEQVCGINTKHCMGFGYLMDGNIKEALHCFDQAIQEDLEDPVFYKDRAIARMKNLQYKEAINDFNKSFRLACGKHSKAKSWHGLCHGLRGICKFELGMYREAIIDFDRSTLLNLCIGVVYFMRADAKLRLKLFKEAMQDFYKTVERFPIYNIEIARTLFDQGLNSIAIQFFNRAVDLDPKNVICYLFRGLAKFQMGDFICAEKDFSQAIVLDPENADCYKCRALAWIQLGCPAKALEDSNKAIELGYCEADIYYTRGIAKDACALFIATDPGNLYYEAMEDLTKAIKLQPKFATYYYNRADIRGRQGDSQGALKDLKVAVNLEPDNIDFRIALEKHTKQKRKAEKLSNSHATLWGQGSRQSRHDESKNEKPRTKIKKKK
jgi:amino acid adenylation domain-containing protein